MWSLCILNSQWEPAVKEGTVSLLRARAVTLMGLEERLYLKRGREETLKGHILSGL